MPDKNDDLRQIKSYLLGDLPSEETERFDELSFTDGDFAQRVEQIENELVDSYVSRELDDLDLQRFRSHFLKTPHRRQKVLFSESLRHHFASRNVDESTEVKRAGFFSMFSRMPALQWAALAAVVLIALTGAWLWTRTGDTGTEIANTNKSTTNQEIAVSNSIGGNVVLPNTNTPATDPTPQIARDDRQKTTNPPPVRPKEPEINSQKTLAFVLPPPLRGSSDIKKLSVPENVGRVAIRLQIESNDFSKYSVSLAELSTNKTVWQGGSFRSSGSAANPAIFIVVPAQVLKPGRYSLTLSGSQLSGNPEKIGDYVFEVVR